jgi:hypothetical protein
MSGGGFIRDPRPGNGVKLVSMIDFGKVKSNATKQSDSSGPSATLNLSEYSKSDQAKYIAIVVISGAILIVARSLRPSSRGVGTHEQLGLPPCIFLHYTGIPCPGCGLTTSFAHAARLHFYDAFITQPFGLILFCLTALSIPLSFYLIYSRVSWARLFYSVRFDRTMYIMIILYLLGWLYKIAAMKSLFPTG